MFKYVDTFSYAMFIEIRQVGKKSKYYLIHTYRVGDKVKRISRYLGSNLSENSLGILRKRADELILAQMNGKNMFDIELTEDEIKYFRGFDAKIEVFHLQGLDWKRFSEDFAYNTNAIEGSAVSHSTVKSLVENKEAPKNDDELESVSVAKAVDYIRTTEQDFSVSLIKMIHKICFKSTKSFAGMLRNVDVVIRDSLGRVVHQGAAPKDIINMLNDLVRWYGKNKKKYPPLLLAALVHNQFERIHPFQDGNGRVGRLLLNYVLVRHKYPPINIRLKDRARYYQTLQEFDRTGDIRPTLRFLILEYRKQYK